VGGTPAPGDQRGDELTRGLRQLGGYYPGQVSVSIGFVDVSIPLLSSDVFLMPSMHEPGGISQLEALVCGCLVVARATGGLRDTITPLVETVDGIKGNGFLFTDYAASALGDARLTRMLPSTPFISPKALSIVPLPLGFAGPAGTSSIPCALR